ncbi:MAG: hypothetical protein IH993_05505 [Proteobacteria bacterium]|nr:hypothetical protein [Pseudomonadota bacterium]
MVTPHFGGRISGVKNDAPFLTAAAVLAAVLVCQSAAAQGACDRRERVLSLLAEKYQETPVAVGVTTQGSLVEVLSHDTGKTWTIVITLAPGHQLPVAHRRGLEKKLQQVAQDPEA